ncbi:MAG TPA: energy transducer TonB [Anaeromyxobacteraceae bacterium]|nr:energy transducer TonB [Anaeromyxobacteraceae bacterium]
MVASALQRRDRIWPAVLVSALVHAGLAGWAVARRAGPEIDLAQKPIVAKLVRLGEKRPENLLPRKEAEPPPAAAPEPKTAPAPTPAPVAAPAAKAAPVLDATKVKAKPAPPSPKVEGKAGGDPLARVMSRMERDKSAEAPRWGDPGGDPEGDASEASEGDRYLALAQRALKANYSAPATIPLKERLHLRATVLILVEANGTIRDARIAKRSGNDAFDASVERSALATRLPPPPAQFKDRYRRDGILVEYTP